MKPLLLFLLSIFCLSVYAQPRNEDITLFSKKPNDDLKGTLVLPAKGKRFSLLILQPGSGPTDRNGNNPLGIKANSYRLLANALAEKNIATLLIDKRGIAGSAKAMTAEADLRFEDYAIDLAAWIRLAKKDKRFSKIFIAGHSEGSLVGMLAAQAEKVNGYISIAGAGERIDKIINRQMSAQSPALANKLDSMLTRLRNEQQLDSVPKNLYFLLRPSLQPYLASWMRHDPCEEIKKLRCPILIIQGTTDIQVEVKQAETLYRCRPDANLQLIPGMNHVLKAAPADKKENAATYADPDLPLVPGPANLIAAFIKK